MTPIDWLFSLAAKGLMVSALGLSVYMAIGVRSAAWRHLVLTTTVFGLLLIPALAIVPPAIWLPIPSALRWLAPQQKPRATWPNPELSANRAPVALADYSDVASASSATSTRPMDAMPAIERRQVSSSSKPAVDATTPELGKSQTSPNRFLTHRSVMIPLWGIGVLACLLRPSFGLLGVRRAHQASQSVVDPGWLKQLDDLRLDFEVRQKIDLRCSAAMSSAMTWGMLHPVILLPRCAETWPESQRRVVLLHELAHIRRYDWTTQLLASICCSLHWFNPAVWWISRQMRIEREQACDDLVLLAGVKPTDYAEELVDLAKQLHPSMLTAIPMAEPSRLEQRVHSILDPRRRRDLPSHRMIGAALALCALLILPLVLVGATTATETEQPPNKTSLPDLKRPMEKTASVYVKVLEADGAPAGDIDVTGEAISKDGKRRIGAFRRSGDVWERGGFVPGERVIVTVTRGSWSVKSKPSKPVDLEAPRKSNLMEFHLPAMTVAVDKPRNGVFFGYTGYMTYVIELKDGKFRYWFESDAKRLVEPDYPLTGKYTVEADTITLQHAELIPLSSIWRCRSVNGLPTLWRRDAIDQHTKSPLKLSVDELRRWGAGSILAFTNQSAEDMWKHRTAPTRIGEVIQSPETPQVAAVAAQQSTTILKPGEHKLGAFSMEVRSTKDPDSLVRNELIVSHGQGDTKIADKCALAYGEGTWAVMAKLQAKGAVWISVVDCWGVHTYEFEPLAAKARFSKPGLDIEARWSMPAKPFLEGPPAKFADAEVVGWAAQVLPTLDKEPVEANTPLLEVRLIVKDEKPEIIRPTVARRTVNYRRLGRFVQLGEKVLGKDDLEAVGYGFGGVFRTHYGIRSDEAISRFEEFVKKHAGRRVALVKDGQVVNQGVLNAKTIQSSFFSSGL